MQIYMYKLTAKKVVNLSPNNASEVNNKNQNQLPYSCQNTD